MPRKYGSLCGVTVYLDDEAYDFINAQAQQQDRTRSYIIVKAIHQYRETLTKSAPSTAKTKGASRK